jgi:hypothetical protein
MFAAAKEYVSTRPMLVFVPFAMAVRAGTVDTVWQSRLALAGTRLRLEQGRLYCRIAGLWHDARLTAAIDIDDASLPSDKVVLDDLLEGGAVKRAPTTGADVDIASVDTVATSGLLPLIRVDQSTEFAVLMTASEELRFAAEQAGLRVLGRDVGEDRTVALSISTPAGDELLHVECDTSFDEWHVATDGMFEVALAFADPEADRCGRLSAGILRSEIDHLCGRLLVTLCEVWQTDYEIRSQQMAM